MKCSYKRCKKKAVYEWENDNHDGKPNDKGHLCLHHAILWLLSKRLSKVELV